MYCYCFYLFSSIIKAISNNSSSLISGITSLCDLFAATSCDAVMNFVTVDELEILCVNIGFFVCCSNSTDKFRFIPVLVEVVVV